MAFDQRRYHQDVIVPLRDQPGGLPAADLVRQYAVELTMEPDQLREHLRQIRMVWNRKSGGVDSSAAVYARLAGRDEQLRAEHGEQMYDPGWWRHKSAEREQDLRGEVKRLAEDLAGTYGGVGRLTRAQLDAIAAQWPGLAERDVGEALQLAGLAVAEPVDLPTTSGMPGTAYRTLNLTLAKLGLPTIVPLLHPDLAGTPFRLLADDAVRLDTAVLEQRIREVNTVASSAAALDRKEALGILRSAVEQGVDLRTVALFQIIERLQAGRVGRLEGVLLVRTATAAGLDQAEAQLLVATLPATTDPGPSAADRIRDLLEDGRLVAARQKFGVLPPEDPAWDDLHRLIEERTGEVTTLRRQADSAARAHQEEEAERLLRAASRIAGDDEELTQQLDRQAPPPPRGLAARAHGGEVRLTWEPPRTGAIGLRYRVLRGDRPPGSPADGEVLGEGSEPALTDRTPTPARTVHYAVFASTGGDWSRPVTAAVSVLPPVAAVQIRIQGTEVVCGWRVHPDAERVQVRRQTGRPPANARDGVPIDASAGGFVDPAVPDLAEVFYGIVAVYRDERRAEAAAPMVIARITARGEAPTFVERLRVYATAIDAATARVHVAWSTPASGTVSIRRAQLGPPWPAGSTVPAQEYENYGEPIIGDRLTQGSETLVEATVPSGQFVYVPFTVNAGAGTAVVGEPTTVGVTEPVRDLRVRRAGSELNLSWLWPPAVNLVEVTFTPADGAMTTRQRLTRGQYAESGCRVRTGPDGGRVTVRGVSRGPGGDTLAAPVSAVVEGAAVQLSYHLERVGRLPGRARRLVVTIDRACHDVELIVVAVAGPAMPTTHEGGVVLQHLSELTLTPQTPLAVPYDLPRGLPKPYWVRCFVLRPAGVRVADPIDEMKVS